MKNIISLYFNKGVSMITHSFVNQVTEKKDIHIYIFIITMVCFGIIINYIEPYPNFIVLFPVLLIMSISTIMILKYCLSIMLEFKKQCEQMDIFENALNILFLNSTNYLLLFIYIIIIIIYFLCLYNLQFIRLNIMGVYILICGFSSLVMAFAAYEIYIRSTITLYRVAIDEESLSKHYNKLLPSHTNWLQQLHKLSKVLKKASLVIGLLFVFENIMIFFANIDKLNIYISGKDLPIYKKINNLPVEFWFIWILVCIAIALAFPITAAIQSFNMKKIIYKIEECYSQYATLNFENSKSNKQLLDSYILINLIHDVEFSLNEKYLSPKFEKFIIILASLLTCILHFATLYNLFI